MLGDLAMDVGLGAIGLAAAAAALVLRLEHLADVLELELDLGLERSRRLPVDDVGARARVPLAERDERDHQYPNSAQDDVGEVVHPAGDVISARSAPPAS